MMVVPAAAGFQCRKIASELPRRRIHWILPEFVRQAIDISSRSFVRRVF
jgi:hypothetical protein